MNWMVKWRTRSKLFVGFGVIFVFLAVVITVAYRTITMGQHSQKKLFDEDFYVAYRLSETRAALNRQRAEVLRTILAKHPADRRDALGDLAQAGAKVQKTLDEAFERSRRDTIVSTRLTEARSELKDLTEKRDAVIALVQKGKLPEAEEVALGAQNERYEKVRALLLDTVSDIESRGRENLAATEKQAADSTHLFVLIGLAALATAAAIGVAFKTMVLNLESVTRQIKDGANVLASSSSEILAATSQVAASATETATAVSQTTATVEEVKQTAQLSNQKAKHVSESAKKAAEISQSGRKAVDDSIEGMTQIRKQMETIGGSIMRLSEQSQAIGEIIASVGDLAEQSNLLSVNAAIEAAKAGEQGKGFAVVAQEVKALAEQSKQATAQVRTILGEIQKATSAVVLSAEQGSKAVDLGMKQVTQSGESIRALSESVADAALAATQIAASSQQQFVGVDQVASAMESIKQASTQNVAGTKQVETAAQNLTRLGSNLQQLVEQFRV